MTHTHFAPASGYKSKTPNAWLPVAAQVADWAMDVARRYDISVQIGPDAAAEVGTACWQPSNAELSAHTPRLLPGVKPETVEFKDKLWRLRHAGFCGALLHEVGHATYSTHVPAELIKITEGQIAALDATAGDPDSTERFYSPRELDVLITLEESRVEARMIADGHVKTWEKPFLVRMALEIVLPEFRVSDTRYGASMGAALTLARVDAGSLDRESGKRFRAMILDSGQLDKDTLDALRLLWTEYQRITTTVAHFASHGEAAWPHVRARQIARDWIALTVSEDEEDQDDLASGAGEGEGEDGTGEGAGGALGKGLGDLAREESLDAEGAIQESARGEASARRVAEVKAEAEQRKAGAKAEKSVYPDAEGSGAHGWDGSAAGTAQIRGVRAPSGDERAAAVRFQRELSRAAYHDVERVTTTSTLPPGRLRGRGAVQGAAQIANRQTVTAEPFRGVRRVHNDQTKLRVAVLSDVSGSMVRAEEATAVLSYVLARGAAGADAKVASILFGDRSIGVVKPGQKIDKIVIAKANHSCEVVKPGLMAADSLLDLTTGSGARVVFILSDSHLVKDDQADYMRNWLARAKRAGVVVVWANYGGISDNHGYGAKVDLSGLTPAQAATRLGQVAVREVARVSATAGR